MSEQQGLSQQDTRTETPVHADKAQAEGGEKPRVKYDKETFLTSSKRVSEIRDKIKSASSLEEIAPLAQEGKAVEQNMRNMFDAAQDEAEAENKAFDERKAEEQKQRTSAGLIRVGLTTRSRTTCVFQVSSCILASSARFSGPDRLSTHRSR